MENVNTKVAVLATVQASGADVETIAGQLIVTGVSPIPISGAQAVEVIGTTIGLPRAYTIEVPNTPVAATTYALSIKQIQPEKDYLGMASVTTGLSAPSEAQLCESFEDKIQALIDGNQVLGTVATGGSPVSSVVFTPAAGAAVADVQVSDGMSVTSSNKTLTFSSFTAPSLVVSAHGLTVGKVYRIVLSGVTGDGAAQAEGRTFVGIPTSTTAIILIGANNVEAISGITSIIVSQDSDVQFDDLAANITDYDTTHEYAGVAIQFLTTADTEAGVVDTQFILFDATDNSATNVSAAVSAILAALSTVSPY